MTKKIDEKIEKYLEEGKKITDDHWVIIKKETSMITPNLEIKKIIKPSKNGPSTNTIQKHDGDTAIRVGSLKDKLEGMKGADKVLKQLGESKQIDLEEGDIPSLKELEKDPLYHKFLAAKNNKEAKEALDNLMKIRGEEAVNVLKKALKNYSYGKK